MDEEAIVGSARKLIYPEDATDAQNAPVIMHVACSIHMLFEGFTLEDHYLKTPGERFDLHNK